MNNTHCVRPPTAADKPLAQPPMCLSAIVESVLTRPRDLTLFQFSVHQTVSRRNMRLTVDWHSCTFTPTPRGRCGPGFLREIQVKNCVKLHRRAPDRRGLDEITEAESTCECKKSGFCISSFLTGSGVCCSTAATVPQLDSCKTEFLNLQLSR